MCSYGVLLQKQNSRSLNETAPLLGRLEAVHIVGWGGGNVLMFTCRLSADRLGTVRLDTGSFCSTAYWCHLAWSRLLHRSSNRNTRCLCRVVTVIIDFWFSYKMMVASVDDSVMQWNVWRILWLSIEQSGQPVLPGIFTSYQLFCHIALFERLWEIVFFPDVGYMYSCNTTGHISGLWVCRIVWVNCQKNL